MKGRSIENAYLRGTDKRDTPNPEDLFEKLTLLPQGHDHTKVISICVMTAVHGTDTCVTYRNLFALLEINPVNLS